MDISPTAKDLIKRYLDKDFTDMSILSEIREQLKGDDPIIHKARILCFISVYNDSVDEELYDILKKLI